MSDETALLRAIVDRPGEAADTWLVLADWLDERDRSAQAELIRLQHQPTFRPDLDARARQAAMIEHLAAGVRPCVPTWTSKAGIVFVWVSPGSFLMGTPPDAVQRDGDEEPQHPVTLSHGFWIADTPITQTQWLTVMDANPSRFPGPDRPVDNVDFNDCTAFMIRLAELEARPMRFLTEAEWEYACRAGTTTPFFWGDKLDSRFARFGAQGEGTVPVRNYPPNAWGLFDMHGNVYEWCEDAYHPYTDGPQIDLLVPVVAEDDQRVERGGSYASDARNCRSAYRFMSVPDVHIDQDGCRVCFGAT